MLRSSLQVQRFRIEQFENDDKGSKIFMEPRFTLQGHLDAVECIDWSKDGTMISSGSRDKIVRVWNTLNGHLELQLLGHQDFVTCLSISPDGKTLASGGRDETVRIWDLQTGQCKRVFDDHCSPVAFVKFNDRGNRLAFGFRDTPIRILNMETGKQTETTMIEGLTGRVVRVSWSPDGTVLATGNTLSNNIPSFAPNLPSHTPLRHLLTGSRDGCIRLYCSETGLFLNELHGHIGSILCLSWSPDNTFIASGGDDKTIRIWDIRTGQQTSEMNRHTSAVLSIDFSPDGQTLVSSSFDTTLRLWDVKSGSPIGILEGLISSPITFVQFSSNYWIDSVSF